MHLLRLRGGRRQSSQRGGAGAGPRDSHWCGHTREKGQRQVLAATHRPCLWELSAVPSSPRVGLLLEPVAAGHISCPSHRLQAPPRTHRCTHIGPHAPPCAHTCAHVAPRAECAKAAQLGRGLDAEPALVTPSQAPRLPWTLSLGGHEQGRPTGPTPSSRVRAASGVAGPSSRP